MRRGSSTTNAEYNMNELGLIQSSQMILMMKVAEDCDCVNAFFQFVSFFNCLNVIKMRGEKRDVMN